MKKKGIEEIASEVVEGLATPPWIISSKGHVGLRLAPGFKNLLDLTQYLFEGRGIHEQRAMTIEQVSI